MKQKNGSRCPFQPVSVAISFQPYRHVSVAILAVSVLVFAEIDLFWCESGRVRANQKEKRKKRRESASWTLDTALDSGATTLEPRRCFLDENHKQSKPIILSFN